MYETPGNKPGVLSYGDFVKTPFHRKVDHQPGCESGKLLSIACTYPKISWDGSGQLLWSSCDDTPSVVQHFTVPRLESKDLARIFLHQFCAALDAGEDEYEFAGWEII